MSWTDHVTPWGVAKRTAEQIDELAGTNISNKNWSALDPTSSKFVWPWQTKKMSETEKKWVPATFATGLGLLSGGLLGGAAGAGALGSTAAAHPTLATILGAGLGYGGGSSLIRSSKNSTSSSEEETNVEEESTSWKDIDTSQLITQTDWESYLSLAMSLGTADEYQEAYSKYAAWLTTEEEEEEKTEEEVDWEEKQAEAEFRANPANWIEVALMNETNPRIPNSAIANLLNTPVGTELTSGTVIKPTTASAQLWASMTPVEQQQLINYLNAGYGGITANEYQDWISRYAPPTGYTPAIYQ